MQREFLLPFKKDLVYAQIGNSAQTRGIRVDNPSGYWLLVEGVDQWVPPFTVGWTYPMVPSQASVTVRFKSVSAAGSLSSETSATVTVTLYDVEQPANPGFLSGAGARLAGVPTLTYIEITVEVSPSPLPTVVFVPALAGFDIVIVSLGGNFTAGSGGIMEPNVFSLDWEVPGSGNIIFSTAFSTVSPYSFTQFAPGSVVVPAADGRIEVAGGAVRSRQFIAATGQYYYQKAAV